MRRTLLVSLLLPGCFSPKVSDSTEPAKGTSSSSSGPSADTTSLPPLPGSTGNTDEERTTTTGAAELAESSTADPASTSTGARGCASDIDCEGWEICESSSCDEPAHVVYLNFEAEGNYFYVPDLQSDATMNRHNYQPIGSGILLEDYGTGPKRLQVVDAVRAHLAPYRVAVTDQRPPSGVDFGMIIMTERPFEKQPGPGPDEGSSIGRGGIDCEDLNPRDISFFFLSEADAHSAELHARFLTGAILRDTGLASVADTGHVLHPYLLAGGGVGEIKDECSDIVSGYRACEDMGTGCTMEGTENAHAWLEFVWGLRG
ncbi:MAG: hypothetical protein KUG77_25630 [Nannocystaceae bacterium]|nr:hypothetical protein [Nannocystaceae bacterium]